MVCQPRDVVRLWDRQVRPNKHKRHICISGQYFLRINSEPLWVPHFMLRADESDFLEHDSYVELRQLVRHMAYEIERAEVIGRLTDTQARRLILAVQTATTLSPNIQDQIVEALNC